MHMRDGSWDAFMADQFPEVLDDDRKKVCQKFYLAAKHLQPEDLPETLPMPLPMTHIYQEEGSTMFGIAKYPTDQWMAAGQPMITTKGW
eukprot:7539794-Prorocentrum_lima.AAC.1